MRKIILPFLILLLLYSNAFAGAEIFLAAKKGSLAFISTWNTGNTSSGSSAVKNIKLPLTSNGTYNFHVTWGDTTSSNITIYNQAEVTHTYSADGVYTITITGVINGFSFNDTGDRLKITSITQWGILQLGNNNSYFYGCANLTIPATDTLNMTGTTDMTSAFENCSSLTTVPSFATLNTANVTNMLAMFAGAGAFNQSVANFNTANVTTMSFMFVNAGAFNQSVANFNTANVTDMSYMFEGATLFNQSVASFNVSKITTADVMFTSSGFTKTNYDLLLPAWAAQTVKSGVPFSAGSAHYSAGTPTTSRAILTVTDGWTVTDGGTP